MKIVKGKLKMEESKEKRIEEIDKRIEDLKKHATMWGRAGGRGGNMMLKAYEEIDELTIEKEDLINGTNKLEIYKIEKELKRLKAMKEYVNIFKKMIYNHEIKKREQELETLKR